MESAETIWDRSHNTLWGADSSTATHGTSAGQASKRRIKRSAIKRFQSSLIDAAQTIGWPNTHGDKSESPATPQRLSGISVSRVTKKCKTSPIQSPAPIPACHLKRPQNEKNQACDSSRDVYLANLCRRQRPRGISWHMGR